MIQLDPYQHEAVAYLTSETNGPHKYLADEQGVGKTFPTIFAAAAVKAKLVLIAVEPTIIDVWISSAKRAIGVEVKTIDDRAPRPTHGWWIVSPMWVNNAARCEKLRAAWDVVIIDEAHCLKTPESRMTNAFVGNLLKKHSYTGITGLAKRIWFLSGTPATKDAADYYVPFRVLFPEELTSPDGKILTYYGFKLRYCQRTMGRGGIAFGGVKNAKELQAKIQKCFFRRTKGQVGIGNKAVCRVHELDVLFSGSLKSELLDIRDDDKFLKELKKVEDHRELRADKKSLSPLQELGIQKASAMVPIILEEAKKRKIVIFCQHVPVYLYFLKAFGPKAVGLNGSTKKPDRTRNRDLFQNNPDVRIFVGQLRAASKGIDLFASDQLWFAETGYVPAIVQQAIARIDRRGQERDTVDIVFAVSKHPTDRRVAQIMLNKAARLEKVMAGNDIAVKLSS